MSDPIWGEFDKLGEVEVRKLLSLGRWGEQRAKMAQAWVDHQESLRASSFGEATVEEAKSANALAREANATAQASNSLAEAANSLASRALARASTNNKIAGIAALIAAIALAVSVFKK